MSEKLLTGEDKTEKRKIIRSMMYPLLFVFILWIIKAGDYFWELNLNEFGLYPLKARGLIGIFTSPLLHSGFSHLFANTVPLLVLGFLLFYFYKPIAWSVFLLTWMITGLWVWVFARGDAIHIGASGIIYGLASFLIFSGIIRREQNLMIITLLVVFLYGGLIWGVFPQFFPREPISWESHLMGLISGIILAIWFRNKGPARKIYEWENEEEDEEGSLTTGHGEEGMGQ